MWRRASSIWCVDRHVRKRLYELMKNRSKIQPRNAPKPVENSDAEQRPEDQQNRFLSEMNSLEKFQNDLWSKGTV
jgi:hypothetical protein